MHLTNLVYQSKLESSKNSVRMGSLGANRSSAGIKRGVDPDNSQSLQFKKIRATLGRIRGKYPIKRIKNPEKHDEEGGNQPGFGAFAMVPGQLLLLQKSGFFKQTNNQKLIIFQLSIYALI